MSVAAAVDACTARRGGSGASRDGAERRYTGHPDDPSACLICGCHLDRHRAADRRCPQTADSLRADDVLGWWRAGGRGGSFLDALDGSPELRARVRTTALHYPEPTRARADEARALIAEALNATDA